MELSRISDLFWKLSPNLFFLSIMLGIASGLAYAAIIPLVIYAVDDINIGISQIEVQNYSLFNSPTENLAQLYLFACALIILVKSSSLILSTYLVRRAAVAHRLSLYQRIQRLTLIDLEKLGYAKTINILNMDVPNITNAAVALPTIWVNTITILGTFAYLFYLDKNILLFVLIFMSIGLITYQLPIFFATGLFVKSRNHFDRVQEGVEGLIYGSKELRLSNLKADEFYSDALDGPEKDALHSSLKGNSILIVSESYGEVISFLIIGLVIFHLPYIFSISALNLFSIVMALLYLIGPVNAILNSIAIVRIGKVSLVKVKDFYSELSEEDTSGCETIVNDWTRMKINQLCFSYLQNGSAFSIKDINLSFNRGEVTFIVGGNGSGKSTLAKCLSLHYQPTQGYISFDEQAVDFGTLTSARQNISAIYSDYHLFSRLYGLNHADIAEKVNEYLKLLELNGKVSYENNQFSTVNLSDGQRKRLALLVLLLEDRKICIFDEWAADQDPHFKEYFYSTILPELRIKNKVIIVISHDDRYFKYANQLVVMENGYVKEIQYKDSSWRTKGEGNDEKNKEYELDTVKF